MVPLPPQGTGVPTPLPPAPMLWARGPGYGDPPRTQGLHHNFPALAAGWATAGTSMLLFSFVEVITYSSHSFEKLENHKTVPTMVPKGASVDQCVSDQGGRRRGRW